MKELPPIIRNLLIAAIMAVCGAMLRFEVVASNVSNMKENLKDNYVKKEQLAEVKTELRDLKEDTKEIKSDIKTLLRKMR